MIIMMENEASEGQVTDVVRHLTDAGCCVRRSGTERILLGVSVDTGSEVVPGLRELPGIADISSPGTPYLFVGRDFQSENSLIDLGNDVVAGDRRVLVMAGPCSIEDAETLDRIAAAVAAAGATILRGGAYKPRSSPYAFQGMGEEGLFLLRSAADRYGLLAVSEVMEASQIPLAAHYCDILQVGTRNMQNISLLKELGHCRRPVLFKRGLASTLEEWLGAAEYMAAFGNMQIVLCERGIRTFETATRNTLDLNVVPSAKQVSHLPIIVDPSHGTGRRNHVIPMARAAVAAGADGVIVEVHSDPDMALCDGSQSLTLDQFSELMDQVRRVADAVDRTV